MATSPTVTRVDVWELRCRFNRGRYYARSQAGEFDLTSKIIPIDPRRQLPYAFSEEWYYLDKVTGAQVARVHQYRDHAGALGGGHRPDPKDLVVEGVRYRLHKKGSALKRDPAEGLSASLRAVYLLWRRLKCMILGR